MQIKTGSTDDSEENSFRNVYYKNIPRLFVAKSDDSPKNSSALKKSENKLKTGLES